MNEASNKDTTSITAAGITPVVKVRTDLAVPSVTNPHASRRGLLGGGAMAAALVAGIVSTSASAASASASSDAELIRVCHKFAEAEFADWYLYVITDDRGVESHHEDTIPDWATLHWIEATPATTLEGLRAKALALVAWHRDAYDNSPDDRDAHTTLLASLMRDLAAPARAVIIARLFERYGPLPKDYTIDGAWLGAGARA